MRVLGAKIFLLIICVVVLLPEGGLLRRASAEEASAAATPIIVLVNFNKVDFPDNQNPYITGQGTTMVPVRGVFEKMNAEVLWDRNEEKKIVVTAKHFDDLVELTVDSKVAYVNGNMVELDVPAELVNGRVAVPLRFLSEAFGGEVRWVPASKSGHRFHYIQIDGQFKYSHKPVEISTAYVPVGYGEPVEVTSLPITVKHKTFNVTIYNISNSVPLTKRPNSDFLVSPARLDGGEPYWEALKHIDNGILRLDVEFEATTDAGFQVDELQRNTAVFLLSHHGFNDGKGIISMLYNSNIYPETYQGLLANIRLKKGEKARGFIPIRHYVDRSSNKDRGALLLLETHSIEKASLKFVLDPLK